MSDTPSSYPLSFHFAITVDGQVSKFQEVSGISREISSEEVSVGGENHFKYRLPTQASMRNLTLKRGLVEKSAVLLKWCQQTIDQGLATPISTKTLTLSLVDAKGEAQMQWVIHKAYPLKYSISNVKSMETTWAVESIELAYSHLELNPT